MKLKIYIYFLMSALPLLFSCINTSETISKEKDQDAILINDFISHFFKQPNNAEGNSQNKDKCYRNGETTEVIYEMVMDAEIGEELSDPQVDHITKYIKEQMIQAFGSGLSVGQIREYGKIGMLFTFVGISQKGKELFRFKIPFNTLLYNWDHPNI